MTYKIKAGDSLARVAAAQGVSMRDLLAANRQITNPDRVQVGDVINIPAPVPAAAAPSIAAPKKAAPAITLTKLNGHVPTEVLTQIPAIIEKFNIDTPLKLAHFLAQCAHESLNFTATTENLNYSAAALKSVFGKYFLTPALCDSYARKPEAIAARVYASRMGNGDEASKDGWKYRGRGFIQLTGKSNYTAFNKFVDDDVVGTPELVAQKYPLLSAAWFFHSNQIIELSTQGATDAVVTLVTKRVNGGTNGLDERIKHFKAFYALLQA
ncbi:LysM peptidoglycan-binding domain-containing protein [Hymenobacter sp. CA1UV-4]|nr:LysM peptidoglycan-binding domain-containing protein [Hymenobacter sp. CA1UV-4]